ncbi:MAG: hypothetical protein PHW72_02640 [Candidatus Pacebacteria bacterium]|nr:hypothetical protein [Candidatus Paceibacterota bacterium]
MTKKIFFPIWLLLLSALIAGAPAITNANDKNDESEDGIEEFMEKGREKIEEFKKGLLGEEMLMMGKVVLATENSLVINIKDKDYTVNIVFNGIIANRVWDKMDLEDFKENDRVMIFGKIEKDTIEAKMVRNISQPPLKEND